MRGEMETINNSQAVKSETVANGESATPAGDSPSKFRALLHRRSLWLIAALLVVIVAAFGYHWAFGKPKVIYSTAVVERGDIESSVVAAGIVQPFKYVDVGAQT